MNNGASITYTATNTFTAGQSVTITGISPATYNITGTIATAFSNQFTITITATTTSYVSGGTATVIPNGNLIEWQDNSGTPIAYVGPAGSINFRGSSTFTSNGRLYIQPSSNSNSLVVDSPTGNTSATSIIKGASSQTSDLTQWQSSTGAIQLRVNSSGQIQSRDTAIPVIVKQTAAKSATITAASTGGGIVTYTATNTFVAGELVTITGVVSTGNTGATAGSGFNLSSATVLSASATQFTITNALSDTYTSGGTANSTAGADIFQVQNSSSTNLLRIASDGTFVAGGNMIAPTLQLTNGTSLLLNGNIVPSAADGSFMGFQTPQNNTFGSGRILISVGSHAQNGLNIRAGGGISGTITAATSSGTSITYSSASGYAVGSRYVSVGQTITVTGIVSAGNPLGTAERGFNVTNAIVTAATTSSITVSASLTDTYTSGGSFITTNTGLTADLQQWQNTAGTAVARVDYFGNISAANMQLEVIPIDDLTYQFDGIQSRFPLNSKGLLQTVLNPFRLLITLDGIIQSISLPEYVWGSPFSHDGLMLDSEGQMAFSEVPPIGTTFVGRVQSGSNCTIRFYWQWTYSQHLL